MEKTKNLKSNSKVTKLIPYLGLIAVVILFVATTKGAFLRPSNLQTILLQAVIVIVAGVGVTFVMAHGNLDFSVGGEMAIAAIVAYFAGQISPWLCLPVAMVTGMACGCFSAWANSVMKIPAFIAGMCVMFVGRGLALGLSMTIKMTTPTALVFLDQSWVYILVMIVVVVVGYILLDYTKIGRYNKAIGANETAAKLSGVNVTKYKMAAFMISGACMGVCALISMVQGRSITSNTGLNVETNTLIALILGGLPLAGGTSVSIRSIVIGALTFYALYNGLVLWGLTPEMINIVKAIVFLACVAISFDRKGSVVPD